MGLLISWRSFVVIHLFVLIKISYFFNRQELWQKAKDRYHNGGGKEKAAKYYIEHKEVLRENAKVSIETCLQKENMEVIDRNMTEDVKSKFKEYKKKKTEKKPPNKQTKKTKQQKNKILIFFFSIKRSEKILTFCAVKVNKKEFHFSKEPIALDLVNINQIVTSDKFKHSDKGCKSSVGYEDGDIIRPLCIKWVDT